MSRKDKASDGRRKDCFLRRPSRRALPHLPISDARASLCIVKILQNPPTFIPKSTPCEPICSPHCCKYEEGAPSKRHELRHGWQGPQHEDLFSCAAQRSMARSTTVGVAMGGLAGSPRPWIERTAPLGESVAQPESSY